MAAKCSINNFRNSPEAFREVIWFQFIPKLLWELLHNIPWRLFWKFLPKIPSKFYFGNSSRYLFSKFRNFLRGFTCIFSKKIIWEFFWKILWELFWGCFVSKSFLAYQKCFQIFRQIATGVSPNILAGGYPGLCENVSEIPCRNPPENPIESFQGHLLGIPLEFTTIMWRNSMKYWNIFPKEFLKHSFIF